MLGYACYADRFAGHPRRAWRERLDYLPSSASRYLHLMPLLQPAPGRRTTAATRSPTTTRSTRGLGTMADLERARRRPARAAASALCLDLVLNHTAREHPWARAARAGDPTYRDFYLFFPDRTMPDAYERTLPEVFPDFAPGSFTWDDEPGGWVWTTFNAYQWDLDWANPRVLRAMLATHALPGQPRRRRAAAGRRRRSLWKRMGTDCQNQPEAHAARCRRCAR